MLDKFIYAGCPGSNIPFSESPKHTQYTITIDNNIAKIFKYLFLKTKLNKNIKITTAKDTGQ